MDLAWGLLGLIIITLILIPIITFGQNKFGVPKEQVKKCIDKLFELAKLVASGLVGYLAGKGGV
jgi:uncharacterized membrane protein (DUF441 family)